MPQPPPRVAHKYDLMYVRFDPDAFNARRPHLGMYFDTWDSPVEGGQMLPESAVECSNCPTVHGRIRFTAERDTA